MLSKLENFENNYTISISFHALHKIIIERIFDILIKYINIITVRIAISILVIIMTEPQRIPWKLIDQDE